MLFSIGHGDSSSKSIPTLVKNIGPVGQVACGSSHTIALSQDGTSVWSFGAGDSGGFFAIVLNRLVRVSSYLKLSWAHCA